MAAELCTRSPVRTVVPKPKYRSSQRKAVQSTVENATRNTDVTRLISGKPFEHFSIFCFFENF